MAAECRRHRKRGAASVEVNWRGDPGLRHCAPFAVGTRVEDDPGYHARPIIENSGCDSAGVAGKTQRLLLIDVNRGVPMIPRADNAAAAVKTSPDDTSMLMAAGTIAPITHAN